MDPNKGSHPSVISMLVLDRDENQEQQPGGNVMVLSTGEEGGKKELVESKPAQDELDQGEPSLCVLAQGKSSQEELPQVSVVPEAKGAVKEGDNKVEEMEVEEASEGHSGPGNNRNLMEAHHDYAAQQQPQQEEEMPEGHAGAMLSGPHRPRLYSFSAGQCGGRFSRDLLSQLRSK
ncbi:hypothetical protein HispidOSU_017017, partial [Sigmodon hispidus]